MHRFYHANTEIGNLSTQGIDAKIAHGLVSARGSSGAFIVPGLGSGNPGATSYSVVGNAIGGRVTMTVRTGARANDIIFYVEFTPSGQAYPNGCTVVVTPGNAHAAYYNSYQPFVNTAQLTRFGFEFWSVTALPVGTYVWNYVCAGW